MLHTVIQFTDLSNETRDILIALLSDSGYEGFEESDTGLQAYISTAHFDKEALDKITALTGSRLAIKDVPETNWNKLWESNFEPVVVDDFCTIRADFHNIQIATRHEILITPKMSFGTGHHATTFMMIQQLSETELAGKSVMDFGTGTGVLAILAEKMGAKTVLAIDNDDWSITNARENFVKNRMEKIALMQANDAEAEGKFDVVLANITRNIIIDNFPNFKSRLARPGILLLSGLLAEDEHDIQNVADAEGFVLNKKLQRGNWVSLQYSTAG